MPDEIVPPNAETPEGSAVEAPLEGVEAPDGGEGSAEPHPLQDGGKRFKQVNDQKKEAQRERDAAIAARAALETEARMLREQLEAVQRQQPPASAPKPLSRQDIHAAVQNGEIDTFRAAELIADVVARESEQRTLAALAQREKVQAASTEVQAYMTRVPALADRTSDEFQRVATAAQELAADMGRTVADPVVQRRALQIALGPLERFTAKAKAEGYDRRTADPGGVLPAGGGPAQPPAKDPLKGAPRAFVDYWAGQGKSRDEIGKMAAKLTPQQRQRLGG